MRQHRSSLDEIVDDLLLIGQVWAGKLPADLGDTSNYRRLRDAQFGVLVTIDGADDPGPLRLSPKNRPTVDLGGHDLHAAHAYQVDDPERRRLRRRLERVWEAHQDPRRPISMERLMGRYLTAVCCVLAAHYQLRPLELGDDGEIVGLGDDIAPALPAAFATAWHDLHRPTLPLTIAS